MKHFYVLLVSFSLSSLSEACTKISYSAHPDYPPFQWNEGNHIHGASIESINIILSELGIKAEQKIVGPWKRILRNIEKGNIDLVLSLRKTTERENYIDYLKIPFHENPTGIFTLKSSALIINKKNDFNGLSGVISLGDKFGDSFDNFIINNLNTHTVGGLKSGFDMLLKNRVNFFITGLYPGKGYLIKNKILNKFKIQRFSIPSGHIYHGFSKKSPCRYLAPLIEKSLLRIKKSGEIKNLIEKNYYKWVDKYKISKQAYEK